MADDLDKEQLETLKKAFQGFAQGRDFITPDTVGTILRMLGQQYNADTLKELIADIDEDGSGQIEFNEFVTLAARFMNEEDEEALAKELKEAFRLYDKQGQGFIPTSCLREILKELDDSLNESTLDGIIAEIDEDGSGTVDFDEFMQMMTG